MTAPVAQPRVARTDGELSQPPELLRPVEPLTSRWSGNVAGWNCYFGNLHAHSSISDGRGTPAEAFTYARDTANINFLCLSEHNHLNKTSDATLNGVKQAAAQAASNTFVGLAGQEYSTISNGNHVNVYNVTERIPPSLNKHHKEFFSRWLPDYAARHGSDIITCQFNHPNDVDDDYGVAANPKFDNYDGDFEAFRKAVDSWVSTIAIISGPADPNLPANTTRPLDVHRDTESRYMTCWKNYLERGFHLGPVADQDNHLKTWGARTSARTGVWVNGPLNERSLLEAIRDERVFATEDKNLKVWFALDTFPMGSIVPDPGERELAFKVGVLDGDEPDSRYVIKIYREIVGDGEVTTDAEAESPIIASGEEHTFLLLHRSGVKEAFYVQVDQEGSRDDAWTAPIYVEPGASADEVDDEPACGDSGSEFVAIPGRNVFHYPQCRYVVNRTNLLRLVAPPAGMRLHQNCPTDTGQ